MESTGKNIAASGCSRGKCRGLAWNADVPSQNSEVEIQIWNSADAAATDRGNSVFQACHLRNSDRELSQNPVSEHNGISITCVLELYMSCYSVQESRSLTISGVKTTFET